MTPTKTQVRPSQRPSAERAPSGYEPEQADWSLLSPQGRVLFYIALCPNASVREIARAIGQTERSAWSLVRALRREGMVRLRKDGRRHFYSVNLDAPLLHPTIHGLTIRPIVGKMVEQAKEKRQEVCVNDDE